MNKKGNFIAKAVIGLLVANLGLPIAVASNNEEQFSSLSNLRVTQSVSVGGEKYEASFFSTYEPSRVTISNRTSHQTHFTSYQGYVAVVVPGDIFSIPCDNSEIAGHVNFVHEKENVEFTEQALCGDLVLVVEEQANE